MIPILIIRGPVIRVRVGSCTMLGISTPSSSVSAPARRWRWTLSNACSWKARGRHSRTPASTPQHSKAHKQAYLQGSSPRATVRPGPPPMVSRVTD